VWGNWAGIRLISGIAEMEVNEFQSPKGIWYSTMNCTRCTTRLPAKISNESSLYGDSGTLRPPLPPPSLPHSCIARTAMVSRSLTILLLVPSLILTFILCVVIRGSISRQASAVWFLALTPALTAWLAGAATVFQLCRVRTSHITQSLILTASYSVSSSLAKLAVVSHRTRSTLNSRSNLTTRPRKAVRDPPPHPQKTIIKGHRTYCPRT